MSGIQHWSTFTTYGNDIILRMVGKKSAKHLNQSHHHRLFSSYGIYKFLNQWQFDYTSCKNLSYAPLLAWLQNTLWLQNGCSHRLSNWVTCRHHILAMASGIYVPHSNHEQRNDSGFALFAITAQSNGMLQGHVSLFLPTMQDFTIVIYSKSTPRQYSRCDVMPHFRTKVY